MKKLKSSIIIAIITTSITGIFSIAISYLKNPPSAPIVINASTDNSQNTATTTINNSTNAPKAPVVSPTLIPDKKTKKETKKPIKMASKKPNPAKAKAQPISKDCQQVLYTPESLNWKSITEISVNGSPQDLLNSGSASVWACDGDIIRIKNESGKTKTIKL